MIDIPVQIAATERSVTGSGDTVSVLLTRRFPSAPEDVWDALTDPDRIVRWFLPITGDLRVGGKYQLQGNAGGEILACDRPNLIRVTFGGENSIVELRLTPDGDGTLFELDHTVPEEMAGSAAGALYVGPGWDGAVMGLGMYLAGEVIGDPAEMANSLEVQEFSKHSIGKWEHLLRESQAATTEQIDSAVAVSLAQFSPDLVGHAQS
jgi:uncharacterized protein YndB with AHSA1/START domain